MLKVGIIGYGKMGQIRHHVISLKKNVKVIQLCDSSNVDTKIEFTDNSDNIKSIYSGKGCTLKKEALLEKLKNVEDLDLVTQEMVGGLKEYDRFKMNRELIDFKKIPMKTRLAFEEYSQNRC